jgi:hypothetical protein
MMVALVVQQCSHKVIQLDQLAAVAAALGLLGKLHQIITVAMVELAFNLQSLEQQLIMLAVAAEQELHVEKRDLAAAEQEHQIMVDQELQAELLIQAVELEEALERLVAQE